MEYRRVNTKQELVSLVMSMLDEDRSAKWENDTAFLFLQALASWLDDADGFYKNMGLTCDADEPSWQLFADALQAAVSYE